jgi:hypothetical protein
MTTAGLAPATLQTLLDIEAIKQLKARYFRSVDSKDWPGFRACFTDDCTFDLNDALVVDGTSNATDARSHGIHQTTVEEVLHTVKVRFQGAVSVHQGHIPEIEILGPDEASCIRAMCDHIQRPHGSPIPSLTGFGHYHERYRKAVGVRRISSLRISRLQVSNIDRCRRADPAPAAPEPAQGPVGPSNRSRMPVRLARSIAAANRAWPAA